MNPIEFLRQMSQFDQTEHWLIREWCRWTGRSRSRQRNYALREIRRRLQRSVAERERFLTAIKWG